jgi:hypothetical protein
MKEIEPVPENLLFKSGLHAKPHPRMDPAKPLLQLVKDFRFNDGTATAHARLSRVPIGTLVEYYCTGAPAAAPATGDCALQHTGPPLNVR